MFRTFKIAASIGLIAGAAFAVAHHAKPQLCAGIGPGGHGHSAVASEGEHRGSDEPGDLTTFERRSHRLPRDVFFTR